MFTRCRTSFFFSLGISSGTAPPSPPLSSQRFPHLKISLNRRTLDDTIQLQCHVLSSNEHPIVLKRSLKRGRRATTSHKSKELNSASASSPPSLPLLTVQHLPIATSAFVIVVFKLVLVKGATSPFCDSGALVRSQSSVYTTLPTAFSYLRSPQLFWQQVVHVATAKIKKARE